MTERIKHKLRLQDLVSPFGVGAIVDIRGESLVANDTSHWDKTKCPEIHCERLRVHVGASKLVEAPRLDDRLGGRSAGVAYTRFPAWRFCERCDRMTRTTRTVRGKRSNTCECGGRLVPLRYVAVCKEGSHVQDIPWAHWVHRGTDCRDRTSLRFTARGDRGEGLASLTVECDTCGSRRNLGELVMPNSLKGYRCEGLQPWQNREEAETCVSPLQVVLRGATGNYMAETESALDIPVEPHSAEARSEAIRGHALFSRFVEDNGGPVSDVLLGFICEDLGVEPHEVHAAAEGNLDSDSTDLRQGEWAAFLRKAGTRRDTEEGDFVVDMWNPETTDWSPRLARSISHVGEVRRVREVRTLKGFRRHRPDSAVIPADLSLGRSKVLPAVELFGEGLFLRFDEDAMRSWEAQPAVVSRASILANRHAHSSWAERIPVPTARLVALHTLAHLVIRRLSFESGYASASLRERLYAEGEGSQHMAGILIYAAAGDAQGTLGGLVRLAAPEFLGNILVAALADAEYCSNDPVCFESDAQGPTQLNLAGCHGCCLVSETSCEFGNRLLDRQLVLGGPACQGLLSESPW